MFDILETYVFERNNPYLHETCAFEKGLQALNDGFFADAILYFEVALQQDSQKFDVSLLPKLLNIMGVQTDLISMFGVMYNVFLMSF